MCSLSRAIWRMAEIKKKNKNIKWECHLAFAAYILSAVVLIWIFNNGTLDDHPPRLGGSKCHSDILVRAETTHFMIVGCGFEEENTTHNTHKHSHCANSAFFCSWLVIYEPCQLQDYLFFVILYLEIIVQKTSGSTHSKRIRAPKLYCCNAMQYFIFVAFGLYAYIGCI